MSQPPGLQLLFDYSSSSPTKLDWFDTDWKQRIPTTVNVGQVPSPQTDFPLLINQISPSLIGAVEAEIRFVGIDHIPLEYEIQKFDNVTGELIAWVKKPIIDNGDITYIYYDNPAAVDEQNPTAVWDANYKSVYHMQNDGKDSTVNAQDLTNFGTATIPIPAKIGNGQDYDGLVTSYSIRNPFAGFPSNEITIEIWLNSVDTDDSLINYFATASNKILIVDQADVDYELFASFVNGGSVLNDGLWHQIVLTWKSSGGRLDIYIDGAFFFNVGIQSGNTFTDNKSLVLGQNQTSVGGGFDTSSYKGILDETRISNNIRSADYVTTSYNNQNNPSVFYSIGTVESAPLPTSGIKLFDFNSNPTSKIEIDWSDIKDDDT